MAISRYKPTTGGLFPRTFNARRFSSFFDDFFNDRLSRSSALSEFTPQTDVAESEKSYEVNVCVPGMRKEDISVDVEDGMLTISGERKFENEKQDKTFHSIESGYGSFYRSFRLPENADKNNIDASYKDGVLTITIPKDQRKAEARGIQIK